MQMNKMKCEDNKYDQADTGDKDEAIEDEHEDAGDIYDQGDTSDKDEATEYEHDDTGDNEAHDDTVGAINMTKRC